MGYIKHFAILVRGSIKDNDKYNIDRARNMALSIFQKYSNESLISPVIASLVNGDGTFAIMPDGGKRGWNTADDADSARREFLKFLRNEKDCFDWCEVMFGGDDSVESTIVAHSGSEFVMEIE